MPTLIDPILRPSVSMLLITVFALALTHKLAAPGNFRATLDEYHLLPGWMSWLLWPVAGLVVAAELMVCVLLLLGVTRPSGAGLALLLLAVYSLSIAVNLLRGRHDMDCGCTWGSQESTLTGWLLVRNASLMALAYLAMATPLQRSLNGSDWLLVSFAGVTLVLLYFAGECLIGNWSRLRRLRTR